MTLLDSGVAWLGKVPSNWKLDRLGGCFRERKETVSDSMYEPLSVTKLGIVPQLESAAKSDNSEGRKLIRAGDFVINSRSDRKGSAGIAPIDGSSSVIYTVLEPIAYVPEYAHHLFRSQPFQEEFYRWGSGIAADLWSTRYSSMKQIIVPVPPPSEQSAIAEYLDRETAQIDNLIAKQEQLIVILEERIRALILKAARGSFPINDESRQPLDWKSGIETSWELRRISEISELVNGYPFDAELFDSVGDMPVVRIRDILATEFETFLKQEHVPSRAIVQDGDVVIGMDGDFNCTFWDRGAAALNQRVCLLRTHDGSFSKWLNLILPIFLTAINELTYSTTVKHLSSNQITSLKVPVPPKSELNEITHQLELKIGSIRETIDTSKSMLAILSERRQALISAAVTGKIEVAA